MSAASLKYHNVAVPEHRLLDVYRLLSGDSDAEEGSTEAVTAEERPSKMRGDWTPDLVRRMYRESPPNSMKVILAEMANRAEEWVLMEEFVKPVEKARGRETTRSAMPGIFGAFGRRVKNRYQMGEWPFEDRWDHESGQQAYRMPVDVAEGIAKELAAEDHNQG